MVVVVVVVIVVVVVAALALAVVVVVAVVVVPRIPTLRVASQMVANVTDTDYVRIESESNARRQSSSAR